MKLITKAISDKLKSQYKYGSDLEKQKVWAKIYNPYGRGLWYLINQDPDDENYIWAIVKLDEVEVGSVSLYELENLRVGPFGFKLERDRGFSPMNALECLKGVMQGQRFGQGGNIEMLKSQDKEIMHHAKELAEGLKNVDEVDAWVVAKAERASTDLSDITHYIDGQSKYANGGMLMDNFTIDQMKAELKRLFPYSFGFSVNTQRQNTSGLASILDYDMDESYYGLDDKDIGEKLYFPQYKRDHEINWRIKQGDENTYFDFLLTSESGKYYVGHFGFKDRGDVDSSYVTRFMAFLMEQYGLPFQVNYSLYAKGGDVKIGDEPPVIRQIFEDTEELEYEDGGTIDSLKDWRKKMIVYIDERLDDLGYTKKNVKYDDFVRTLDRIYTTVEKLINSKILQNGKYFISYSYKINRSGYAEGYVLLDSSIVWDNPQNVKDWEEYKAEYKSVADKKGFIAQKIGEITKPILGYPLSQNSSYTYDNGRVGASYAKGGSMASFDDKVKAISKSLEGKKVKPKYQSKYGKTYDKAEAKEAATKIAGKMTAKERAKSILSKRKK